MEKEIKGFPGYAITDDGKVISYKYKEPRIMKTWYQKSGYENIKLCKENTTYHFLVHRLVAEAFIPNPNNLPEVNHKDKNRQNNCVENLEWTNRINNLYDSYSTMTPTRNFRECVLIKEEDNTSIKSFQSVKAAAEYANEMFGCSISGMRKNYKSRGYRLEFKKCND